MRNPTRILTHRWLIAFFISILLIQSVAHRLVLFLGAFQPAENIVSTEWIEDTNILMVGVGLAKKKHKIRLKKSPTVRIFARPFSPFLTDHPKDVFFSIFFWPRDSSQNLGAPGPINFALSAPRYHVSLSARNI